MNALSIKNNEGILLTMEQACEMTNLGSRTIRRLADEANAVRKIGKCYRINRVVLLDYIEREYSI